MWRYIEEYNYADTWRDPDAIHYANEKLFNTLKEALAYGRKQAKAYDDISYMTIKGKDFTWNKKIKSWVHNCTGSYAPVLIIAKYE